MHSSAATDSASAQESTKLTKEIQKLEKQMAKLEVAAQKNETKAFVRLESQVKILEKKSALTKDANVKAEYTEAIAELRGNYEVWVDEMHLRVQDALDAMEMELDRKKDRLEEVQEALEVH